MNDQLKRFLFDWLVEQALAELVRALPLLGNWFFSPIVNFFVKRFADALFKVGRKFMNFTEIDFETDKDKKVYRDAILEFSKITSTNPTPEEVENARQKVRDALKNAITLNPDRVSKP